MRRELLVGIVLVAAVAFVYWPVHSYPFVLLDDQGYVMENPLVRNGLTRDDISYAFTGITVGNWHPLTMLSHMLDCELYGAKNENAGKHHLTNVALHAANTLLLFIVLRLMTGAVWRSALVAALFGLHPLHVESVAWISERKDVLSTFFFMLMLLAYYRYAQRRTFLRYMAVFLLLVMGLMSKPMLVTAPLVLLLLDYWPLGRMKLGPDDDSTNKRSLKWLIVEKIPLFILVALSAQITMIAQGLSGAMGMLGENLTFMARLENAICSYGLYMEKAFWPRPLAAIYPYTTQKLIDVLIIGIALAAITVAAVGLAKIKPFLAVGWFWYVITLVPVIGLVQVGVQSMADRYTYIPLIGIFIIAAWGGNELIQDWPRAGKAVAAAGTVLVLGVFSWLTWQQVQTWSSSEALFSHAAMAVPYNFVALDGLGKLYWQQGRLDDAKQQFEAVLKIESDPRLHAGGLEPAHRALGMLLAVELKPKQALAELDKAIEIQPRQADARRHKAWILATYPDDTIRNGKQAVELAKQALELSRWKPAEFYDTLAVAHAETLNFNEAVAAEEKAIDAAKKNHTEKLLPAFEKRLDMFKSHMRYHAAPQRPTRI